MGDANAAISGSLAPSGPAAESVDSDARMRRLVESHYDFVWRVMRRLGVPEASAEDATQDVFIIVDRKTREFWPDNEKSYLFAVALRVAAEKRRTERRRAENLELEAWSEIADHKSDLDIAMDQQRARAVVDEILDFIPFEHRIVFVLFELEDMTTAEIAQVLGIPNGTVASRLRRGREIFQQAVQRYKARASKRGAK